jgi:putative membrane protein
MIPALLAAVGLLGAILLALHYDAAAIGHALGAVGIGGMVEVAVVRLLPLTMCALAWRSLQPSLASFRQFLWFRWTRDAAGDLLAFVPMAGELAALRAMAQRGLPWPLSTAALIADLSAEMAGQAVFTSLGILVLIGLAQDHQLLRAALIGLGLLVMVIAAFFTAQRWGVGRLLAGMAQRILPIGARGNETALLAIDAHLRHIYAHPWRVGGAILCHSTAWFLGITEAGLALWLMGDWPGLGAVLVLEAVVFALRSTAFFVPAGLGVQEASYVFLGAAFGIGPEAMIALAVIKRARELFCGIPILVAGELLGVGGFSPSALPPASVASHDRA